MFVFLINQGSRKLKAGLEMPKYEMFEIVGAHNLLKAQSPGREPAAHLAR